MYTVYIKIWPVSLLPVSYSKINFIVNKIPLFISANGLDGKCYVMFTDYDNDNLDAWTYGCLIKGSLEEKCHKSFVANGVTNNYCCCTTPLCNDKNFAANCKGGVNSSVKSAPCYAMMIVLAAMASIVLAMVQL